MMDTMIKETAITFKEIEQKIFEYHCQMAREETRAFLEAYDINLMESRDKSAYRNKGFRDSSVKTVYGEVEYRRTVYRTTNEEGQVRHVYLLDEMLDLKTVGMISQNYAEKLVSGITTKSYRNCAKFDDTPISEYRQ